MVAGDSRDDLARGLDAVEIRHGDIHNDHPGVQLPGQPHRGPPILGLGHHFQIGLLLQQKAESLTDNLVIIGDQNFCNHLLPPLLQYFKGTCKVTLVPQPGSDTTSR